MSLTSPKTSEEGLWGIRVHIVHETQHFIRIVRHSTYYNVTNGFD